jgi:CRP-like cAMP-binding protein
MDRLKKEVSQKGFEPLAMSLNEKAEHIDRAKWLGQAQWHQIQILAEYVEVYRLAAGKIIFKQGERDVFMGLVIEGCVNILKESADHLDKVITTLRSGKTIGEMALIDGEPRSATAITTDDTILMLLGQDAVQTLFDKYPKLWGILIQRIAKTISQRLRQTSGELVDYLDNA